MAKNFNLLHKYSTTIVMPAKAGIQPIILADLQYWIPAFAGMTTKLNM